MRRLVWAQKGSEPESRMQNRKGAALTWALQFFSPSKFWDFFSFNNFIYLFLCCVGSCCSSFSLVAAAGTVLELQCTGLSLQLLLLQSMGFRAVRLQSLRLPGSRAQAQ